MSRKKLHILRRIDRRRSAGRSWGLELSLNKALNAPSHTRKTSSRKRQNQQRTTGRHKRRTSPELLTLRTPERHVHPHFSNSSTAHRHVDNRQNRNQTCASVHHGVVQAVTMTRGARQIGCQRSIVTRPLSHINMQHRGPCRITPVSVCSFGSTRNSRLHGSAVGVSSGRQLPKKRSRAVHDL